MSDIRVMVNVHFLHFATLLLVLLHAGFDAEEEAELRKAYSQERCKRQV